MKLKTVQIIFVLIILLILGYYIRMNQNDIKSGSPDDKPTLSVDTEPKPSALSFNNQNKRVEYILNEIYPGIAQTKYDYVVTNDNLFIYELHTDYSTKPETRKLTAVEVETLDKLVKAIEEEKTLEGKPLPEQKSYGSLVFYGTVNYGETIVENEPKIRIEFLKEEFPSKAVEDLVDFLVSLHRQI